MENQTTANASLPFLMPIKSIPMMPPPLFNGTMRNDSTGPTSPDWIVVPSVFALIFTIGVLGNGILIVIVAANRNMKTTPNVLLVSLAAGDLLLILISSPFTSVYYFYDEWPFGEVMCKLNEFLVTLSLGVSVFTLTALSGERYMVIVFPMQTRRGSNSMSKTVLMAAMIWIVSALLASLDLFMAQVVYVEGIKKQIATCAPYPPDDESPVSQWYPKFYTIFRFLVYFLVPIIIIATFYIFMAVILLRSSNNMPGEAEVKSRTIKQVEARKNVARIVLACVFIFIFCWLPRHVYMFWYHFDPGQYNMFWHLFKICGFCLSFMNSCVNPFALYFLSDQFRRYYNRYLFRKLCCCFMPLCKKSLSATSLAEGGGDDETATTHRKRRSVLEMISLKVRRASTSEQDQTRITRKSGAGGGGGGGKGWGKGGGGGGGGGGKGGNDDVAGLAGGKQRSKFAIFEGKRGSPGHRDRRRSSNNTANGRIFQKLLKSSKKEKTDDKPIGDVESTKVTAQSTI